MSDNVIILGAGASADAGIPLLGTFMDTMWTLSRSRGAINLSNRDREILDEAIKVREDLDGYHGRAALDVWNIEDILSILSFNALASTGKEKKRLEWMTMAIARVIELTCRVAHDGKLNAIPEKGRGTIGTYVNFWRALIAWAQEHKAPIPPILTFNYDLVLERSLLHSLVGTHFRGEVPFNFEGIEVGYSTAVFNAVRLRANSAQWRREPYSFDKGLILEDLREGEVIDDSKLLRVELLKLHGSVNFPRPRRSQPIEKEGSKRLTTSLEDPLILPPVFNKATDSVGKDAWARALVALRSCKNLIICGYSLPATDIYMQYFLKAALGPNQDLNHIYVFDPVLFREDHREAGKALRERYDCNFSEPIQRRIDFRPWCQDNWKEEVKGTMEHLTWLLQKHPEVLLFD